MWELYDDLISNIPANAVADDIICGWRYTAVTSDGTCGIAGTLDAGYRQPLLNKKGAGTKLRDLAECIKSWDFQEASVGQAAINAWFNSTEQLAEQGITLSDTKFTEDRKSDPFIQMQREIEGKRVTVIGHFPYIDQLFKPKCELAVIEKFNPVDGDYPEQATDYLLPNSDFVFISGYTLAEKSLPRYLKLCANAYVTVVGPSSPIAPALAKYGVNCVAGLALRNVDDARKIALGHGGSMHSVGQKINLVLRA
jgi:uncharacterized protein (DUF4213/DUF364 family)